jgi:hypothetical protein
VQLVRLAPCHICKVASRALCARVGHSGCQGINSRIPPSRVAPGRTMRQLESCSRRRETASGWRKPSSWLSEKPANVSIAGGNAVTAKVLVATANQHGCHRLRETTSPQDLPFAMGKRKGRRQTGRHHAWQSVDNLLKTERRFKTASPNCKTNAT